VLADPIKPTLTALGTKCVETLKLKRDEPLSNFAFKFNLRRFIKAKLSNVTYHGDNTSLW